jgi:hypothetical protein
VKTYIGQRGRDKVLRVWVEHHGRRYPIRPDGLAGRILSDCFGLALPKEDLDARCKAFREVLLTKRLERANWTLTETEVRAWNANFVAKLATDECEVVESDDQVLEPEPLAEPEPVDNVADEPPSPENVGTTGQELLVAWGREVTRATILHVSPSVLLLEGDRPRGRVLTPGVLVRIGRPGRPPAVPARLAADGQNRRYLLALGSRAVRGTPRVRVSLPGMLNGPGVEGPAPVRIVDLSPSGARLRGVDLQVGADCELSFVPPGRRELVTRRCVVVHTKPLGVPAELVVAFRL